MINLDDAVVADHPADVLVETSTDEVAERIRVAPRGAIVRRTDRFKSEWDAEALRDYVLAEMVARFGEDVYDAEPYRINSIFKGFVSRWGEQAKEIARYAFEVRGGCWMGQPVTPSRFTKGNDPYFAEPISERLLTARALSD